MQRWGFIVRVALAAALVAACLPVASVSAVSSYSPVARWPEPTWHLKSNQGVAADTSGNVYVADTGNNEIKKYDSTGRFVRRWGGAGTDDGKFAQPYAVAVSASNGHVYVADTGNHRIQEFTADGVFVRKWGKIGGSDYSGSGDGEFKSPEGVAVDQYGSVYVADTGNARVQKFTAAGVFAAKWGQAGSGTGMFLKPSDIAIAPDDTVLVLDRDDTNSYVQRFDASGTFLLKFGGATGIPPEAGKFNGPGGMTVDAAGSIWVTDNPVTGPRIQCFNPAGEFVAGSSIVGRKTWLDFYDRANNVPGFQTLAGLAAVGPADSVRLLVCDVEKSHVREFDSAKTTLSIRGSWGKDWGRFDDPAGLVVAPSGSLYVADGENNRVQRFRADGQVEAAAPALVPTMYGTQNGRFNSPAGVAVDDEGYVYVVDRDNNRVQKLGSDLLVGDPVPNNPNVAYVTKWGASGTGDAEFATPRGIAFGVVAGQPRILVADTDNNRIQLFDKDGYFQGKWGTAGAGSGQFNKPWAVAVSPDGSVYVADTGNHRVQKFSGGGTILKTWGAFGTGNTQFKNPSGICCDADGRVYVADTDNDRIQVFDAEGAYLATLGTSGSWLGELSRPRGVSVSANGKVYVADSGNHRVQVFAPPVSISVTGVSDGGAYNGTVTPAVSFDPPAEQLTAWSITLNGQPWTPEPLDVPGEYTLVVTGTSPEGSSASETVDFVIDVQNPSSSSDAVPLYTGVAHIDLEGADDLSGVGSLHWKLTHNGQDTFGSFSGSSVTIPVSAIGDHRIEFYAVDRAGNQEPVDPTDNVAYFQVRGAADLSMDVPATVYVGSTATVAGTLSRSDGAVMAGKSVYLWTSPNGTNWTRVATPSVSDGTGAYSFNVTPTLKTYYKAEYEGDPDCAAGFSAVKSCAPMLPVFRFYNTGKGVHFYTASVAEKDSVIANLAGIYKYEGVGYQVNISNPDNKVPLYRFFNVKQGVHFYTASEAEANNVIAKLSSIYKYEGIAYKVSSNPSNGTPVYRFYHVKAGVHFYTASEVEKNNVVTNLSAVYKYEGVGYYIGN